ncbi:hypothetical protein HCH_03566 [Hahella chejuensis KCTC 2396]|uniref:Uncharacterized protein n=1 Tax=Hahella chejuensis (strain KCTC 2396) TaxID=349521 RepID=Q2SGB6_HAHCH|nr:hypothetical protein [Hahella chejuensis]ABC30308.1 hypothetical protein HCH_03566 [Hahella chejuensis KCTC 2396]
MISWVVNVVGLCLSFYFTDLTSESVFASIICPVLIALFLISIALKTAVATNGSRGYSRDGGGGGGFFGGDGGCGGDGGGGGGD